MQDTKTMREATNGRLSQETATSKRVTRADVALAVGAAQGLDLDRLLAARAIATRTNVRLEPLG